MVEVRSFRRSAAKHIDLLPQDQVFRFQRCSRLEARRQDTEDQLEQIGHRMRAYAVRLLRLRRIEFSVHTGTFTSYSLPALRTPRWVIRDRIEPASSPAMSAMPQKAEVNS